MEEGRTMPLKLNETPTIYLAYQIFPKVKSLKIEDKGVMELQGTVISERKFESADGEGKLIKTFEVSSAKPKRKRTRLI